MRPQHGFTLIEMAIVLVIITILIGGLAVPLTAQIQARRIAETNRTLEDIREALLGYAMRHHASNGRPFLPCPDSTGDGVEDRSGSGTQCTVSRGWVPWVTLGTGAQDAWGNRFHYNVTAAYSDVSVGFPVTPSGSNQICDSASGGCASGNVAANVPAVILSYGPNGWGARNVNGNTLAAPTSADELENTDADASYVSRAPSAAGSAAGEFDDLVIWISDSLFTARVCPQGGCP